MKILVNFKIFSGSGTRTSTLTIAAAAVSDDSDAIECYDDTLQITQTVKLHVIGKYMLYFLLHL